jgi:hypothetical protein
MRHIMMVVLLCACGAAPTTSVRQPTKLFSKAEVESAYKEFQKELLVDHYDKAREIATKFKLDPLRVTSTFTAYIWEELVVAKRTTVSSVKSAFDKFKADRQTANAFAVKAFNYYTTNDFCETAGDVVVSFELGSVYAEKAIHCAETSAGFNYVPVARLACRLPGIKELQTKLLTGWVDNFRRTAPSLREYFSWWRQVAVDEYFSMGKVVEMCPLTEAQYLDLFMIGLQDKKAEFTKAILDKSSFKKTVNHYNDFVVMAVGQYQCAMAAEVALKNKLADKTIAEKIFLSKKCQGGNLGSVDLKLIPKEKAEWFFDLSLRAQEFKFARGIIKVFSLDQDRFNKLVTAGLAAPDYESVLLFEPWYGERTEEYRDGILNKILDANEEWAVVTFVVDHSTGDQTRIVSETNRNAWLERTFLHAFRRGEFSLAADVANRHLVSDFKVWATKWVFEAAMQARNADSAKMIAVHYKLGSEALRRVAVLYFHLKNEKDRKLEIDKKRAACEAAKKVNDWEIKKCN